MDSTERASDPTFIPLTPVRRPSPAGPTPSAIGAGESIATPSGTATSSRPFRGRWLAGVLAVSMLSAVVGSVGTVGLLTGFDAATTQARHARRERRDVHAPALGLRFRCGGRRGRVGQSGRRDADRRVGRAVRVRPVFGALDRRRLRLRVRCLRPHPDEPPRRGGQRRDHGHVPGRHGAARHGRRRRSDPRPRGRPGLGTARPCRPSRSATARRSRSASWSSPSAARSAPSPSRSRRASCRPSAGPSRSAARRAARRRR